MLTDFHDPTTAQESSLEEILSRPCAIPIFPEQNQDGIDLSLVRRNLRLSVEERIRRSDYSRWQAEQLRDHAKPV